MKQLRISLVTGLLLVGLSLSAARAEVKPLIGLNLFGGAERGTDSKAGGIGGLELFGVAPFTRDWGFQGSLGYTGKSDTHRVGVSGGPIFSYSSGKVGLFVDYEYKH